MHRLTEEYLRKLESIEEEKRYEILERFYLENTSNYYFSGNLVAFYSYVREYYSKEDRTCDISTNVIKKGQLYISYRPLVENIETRETFVLKRTIRCEPIYHDLLPTNILEFENLNEQIMNYENYQNKEIYFDHLHYSQGGYLKLVKLKK